MIALLQRIRESGARANPALFRTVAALALAVATLAVYLPARHHGFVSLDDADYVSENPMVRQGLSWAGVKWAFTTGHASNWHPLTWLSHQLDAQIFGPGPSGPHLVNVLLHLASTLLLFGWLRRITGSAGRSAWVAAMFALHPLHVESVAWIAERKDVLSAFFFLLTLQAYTRHAATPAEKKSPRLWYGTALLLFALGLLCKPMLVTLPVVLLLLDWWPLRRWSLRTGLDKIPFFALSAASCVVTLVMQRRGGAVASLANLSLGVRLENAVVSYARYLGKLVWPSELAVFYPHPGAWPAASVAIATLLVAGPCLAAVIWRRRLPFLATGWWWFFVMLIPVIGVVQVGLQAMADRYAYLPSIGFFVIVAWGAAAAAERWSWPRPVLGIAAGATAALCVGLTAIQLRYWRESETLFRHALEVTEKNHIAHNSLGYVLLEKGRVEEAAAQFERALEIEPDFADGYLNLGNARLRQNRTDEAAMAFKKAIAVRPDFAIAHSNLGVLLMQRGQVAEAIVELEKFAALRPDDVTAWLDLGNAELQQGRIDDALARYREALALDPSHPDAHNNLGNALLHAGRVNEAVEHFQAALKTAPAHANANYHLGEVFLQRGRLDDAAAHFEKVLESQPDDVDALRQLAAIALQKGRPREAIARYETALKLQPANIPTLCDLAWLRATSPDAEIRNGAEAMTLALRADQLTGGENPMVLCTLAAAYAESGRFAEASATAKRALQQIDPAAAAELAQMLSRQIQLYQSGAPFREGSQAASAR